MALPDTLPLDQFDDLLRVQDCRFVQVFNQQKSISAGGETWYSDRAPALWKAEVTSIPLDHADSMGYMARINSRAGGIKTLLLYDKRLPAPADDPEGLIMSGQESSYLMTNNPWNDELLWNDSMPWGGSGVFNPRVGSIVDRMHVSFTGLPPYYVIRTGTYFGIVFDTSRYYLGQFVEDATATAAGDLAATEVWPPLPASVTGTPEVEFIHPPAKFRIEPGSAYPEKVDALYSTIRFTAEQTYSR